MATTTQPISLPIGPNGQNARGNLVTNSNGDAEWYEDGQPLPKFTSNKSSDYRWIPSPNCDNVLGTCPTPTQRQLFYSSPVSENNLNQARINTFNSPTGFNSPQLAQQLGLPKAKNIATPAKPKKPDPSAPTPPDTNPDFSTTIAGETVQKAGAYNPNGKPAWIYPTGLGSNNQDYIEFMMLEYGGIDIQPDTDVLSGIPARNINQEKILGRVFLPIQPSISETSTVDWQGQGINPLELLGAQASLNLMTGNFSEKQFSDLTNKFKDNKQVLGYLQQWAAGKAVGLNIFSRFSGAVVNPNLELLFNGPQLRPFNFDFRLSPRSQPEAAQVKGIISFFKKGMAVRKVSGGLFLKAPNVFKIVYRNGNNKNAEHTSINNIKICALTSCTVDYTPDGTYSTFYDKEATMTQYGLRLQFSELEPIFNEEQPDPSKSVIGY